MVKDALNALEASLRSESMLDREAAGLQLAVAGPEGTEILGRVAMDRNAPTPVRVTALRHLPPETTDVETLRALLGDALAELRVVALGKVERAHAVPLAPLVEMLTRDPATVWDLDEEIVLAEVAARVLASLRTRG